MKRKLYLSQEAALVSPPSKLSASCEVKMLQGSGIALKGALAWNGKARCFNAIKQDCTQSRMFARLSEEKVIIRRCKLCDI